MEKVGSEFAYKIYNNNHHISITKSKRYYNIDNIVVFLLVTNSVVIEKHSD